MATAEYDVILEAEKALYVGEHRGTNYDRATDKAKSHGTPYQPKRCACQGCIHGFSHIAGVIVR